MCVYCVYLYVYINTRITCNYINIYMICYAQCIHTHILLSDLAVLVDVLI